MLTQPPSKRLQLLLLLVITFNVIPHTFVLPPWITATSATFLLWTALHLFKDVVLPPTWLRTMLAIAGTLGVFLEWHTILGQEPATGLLVYLASLKMLEATRYRDAMLIIFTSYFLLMAHLLVSQSLPSTLYMGCDVLIITALMFHLHSRDRRTSARSLRPAMRLLGISLPVWIFLFLIFPRFSAGFWSLNSQNATQTGFSDSLNPGEVERLVESDEPAFRVTFRQGTPPSPLNLYWRGSVLSFPESALRWSRSGPSPDQDKPTAMRAKANPTIVQEIALEPIFRKWLFALDVPRDVEFDDPRKNAEIRRRPGMIFETAKEVGSRALYQAISIAQHPSHELSSRDRSIHLHVPADITDDVAALAARLNSETDGTTEARVARVMKYFDDEEFRYTKTPGALKTGLLREFLFETKVGFCEHYAASFATLMRLMGVPSRVVVGFQGGVYNGFGRYVLVRSLDAHAWAEVWNEQDRQWQRIDPTATIAPLRLRIGGDYNLMDESQIEHGASDEAIRDRLRRGWAAGLGWRARLFWDATAMRWNNFLLRYDFQYQQQLLSKLGFSEANRWIFFLWMGAGLLLFVVVLQAIFRMNARKEDPVLDGYHRFCARCEALGLPRAPNEGPLAFATRLRAARPDAAAEIDSITSEFIALRYGSAAAATPDNLTKRSRRAREFRKKAKTFLIRSESRLKSPPKTP